MSLRADHNLIASWVAPGSRVLDLGCSRGTLLMALRDTKDCRIQGVDIRSSFLLKAVADGVPLIQMNIDEELDRFADASFDVVILSRTLQLVRDPATVLEQMLRIAPAAIVSMPNFAYWRNRFQLLHGRAPMSKDLPYEWHNSPNFHFGSVRDLEQLFADL
ncbi:MAG: methionine biosynthesis protein MetW, partial [Propionibacteriaceae bacterium]|nr:methionine biosynthesis protein MetW [Propionibacteriaceae bacterium]